MNFLTLDYFLAVARERSFTRAAEALHMTQQSLSAQIAGLEKELGCQLFVRHIPLELTYAGQTLQRYASDIQQLHRTLRYEFSDIARNRQGELRLGLSFIRSQQLMPAAIDAFRREYPRITFSLMEGPSDTLYQQLTNGELDLAIATFPHVSAEVELQDFFRDEVVLLLSRRLLSELRLDAAALQQSILAGDASALAPCPFLLVSSGNNLRRLSGEFLRQCGFQPIVHITAGNIVTLLELGLRGSGACFANLSFARSLLSPEELDSMEIFHLPPPAQHTVSFAYLRHSYQWSMISEFIRVARETYAATAAQ